MSSTIRHWTLLIGGLCSGVSVLITMYNMTYHLIMTRHLALKAYTIRILLMVPIYAIESIFGILWPNFSLVLVVFRSCYEAFALFSFVQLMLAYLTLDAPSQGDGAKGAIWVALNIQEDDQIKHISPFCMFSSWPMGPIFLRRTLTGVFQYSLIMPFVTILTGLFEFFGEYGDALNDFKSAYPYLALIQNLSQCWALYCLVLFYKATSSRLSEIRPLNKFVCIKMVVFFTWWQDFLIEVLVDFNIIDGLDLDGHGKSSPEEVASLLSNFIVCIEMLVMAIVFGLSFPSSDYQNGERKNGGRRYLLQNSDVSFLGDTLITGGPQSDSFDPEMSPWESRGQLEGESPLAMNMAKDLVKSVAFLDVLRDMSTMAKLGKTDHSPSSSSSESQSVSSSDNPNPNPITFQERMFGKRKKHFKKIVSKNEIINQENHIHSNNIYDFNFETQNNEDEVEVNLEVYFTNKSSQKASLFEYEDELTEGPDIFDGNVEV